MTGSDWNPDQYNRFRDERRQPFFDLLALVERQPDMRVIDLGCGTGELTRILHDSLQASQTLGVDSSASMLAKSAGFACTGLRFEHTDLRGLQAGQQWDLIFSNATLQWVDGHETLLEQLKALLAPSGQLAVQVPANHDHASHRVAVEVATEPPFRDALGGYVRTPSVLLPERYAALLHRLGFREQHVRLQVYGHELGSRDDVVEWVKGTMLIDYQRRMPAALFEDFLARYRVRLLPLLDDERPYFYPFKRIVFWAQA